MQRTLEKLAKDALDHRANVANGARVAYVHKVVMSNPEALRDMAARIEARANLQNVSSPWPWMADQ